MRFMITRVLENHVCVLVGVKVQEKGKLRAGE
jgi:hypothetical protein